VLNELEVGVKDDLLVWLVLFHRLLRKNLSKLPGVSLISQVVITNSRGSVLTSLCATLFISRVFVDDVVFLEEDEYAFGLLSLRLLPSPISFVDPLE
jgi:hypothetical protein